jgi:hypothetical protein
MEMIGRGDVAMNLIGLILIAALSGGIVAVSLRLRASASSAAMWLDNDRSHEPEGQRYVQRGSSRSGRRTWLALNDEFGN